ncbi:UB2E1 enzyme, partial [Podilymbus podiceps]|nr:UB2E1 enzyme [Podilymbus podiceps]
SAGPKGDNIYEWRSTILGPPGSVYEGGVFFLDITFTPEYPFKPPKIQTINSVYSDCCNVPCLCDFLVLNSHFSFIFKFLFSNLPEISGLVFCFFGFFSADPLVGSIATQYMTNRAEHDRMARQWTKRYAT